MSDSKSFLKRAIFTALGHKFCLQSSEKFHLCGQILAGHLLALLIEQLTHEWHDGATAEHYYAVYNRERLPGSEEQHARVR